MWWKKVDDFFHGQGMLPWMGDTEGINMDGGVNDSWSIKCWSQESQVGHQLLDALCSQCDMHARFLASPQLLGCARFRAQRRKVSSTCAYQWAGPGRAVTCSGLSKPTSSLPTLLFRIFSPVDSACIAKCRVFGFLASQFYVGPGRSFWVTGPFCPGPGPFRAEVI